jgi:hypothetical protein
MDLREPDLRAMSYARVMRRVPVLPIVLTLGVCLGGCITPANQPPPSGWTGPGGHSIDGCKQDVECGTAVCARDGTCQPASSVHAVHVSWTLRGKPADATTCAQSQDLEIQFTSSANDRLGFAPVPCRQGKFTIDKLPIWYNLVDLGRDSYSGSTTTIDRATGNATIDLPY